MEYKVRHMTRNDCYTAGRKIKPTGIVVHSTATPGVMAAAWFSRWNKSVRAGEMERSVCAHMFLDDKEAWEYLPINPERGEAHRSWLHGGSANNTHLGFEMCEPGGFTYRYPGAIQVGYDVAKNQAYFDAVYKNAVAMCVKWCREFGIKVENIIDHAEGSRMGICSASADVGHWFPKHGKSMNTLRADVKKALEGKEDPVQGGKYVFKIGTVQVNTSLNVRSSPRVESGNLVGSLSNGDQVPVIGEGTWLKIIYNDAVAYVHSEHVKVEDASGGTSATDKARIDSLTKEVSGLKSEVSGLKTSLSQAQSTVAAKDKALKTIGAGIREAQKH